MKTASTTIPCREDQFVCFSPETFVKIRNGRIYSYPMKGTLEASTPNAAEILMADKKEAAEHATIVDLIAVSLHDVALYDIEAVLVILEAGRRHPPGNGTG